MAMRARGRCFQCRNEDVELEATVGMCGDCWRLECARTDAQMADERRVATADHAAKWAHLAECVYCEDERGETGRIPTLCVALRRGYLPWQPK